MSALLLLVVVVQAVVDGSILGTVKDSSGAVVPGAEVVATNLETGLVRAVTADAGGYFEVLALPRGFYAVVVSSPGFKTWRVDRTELSASEQKRVFPVLTVGEVQEQVTVSAGVELMQTEKGSLETAIEQRQVRDLPINGRNPIAMANLVPGMRFQGVGGLSAEHTVQGVGQREDQTTFSVDGLDANDPSNEKGIAFPNLETVAQFTVQTSAFTAENGRNPLQVVMVTKSGTNEFHGTLWEFHRNGALDARNAFSPSVPKLIRNQFGFSAGGPILRNRTFFFGSDEGTRIRQQMIYNSPTISPAMLQGDFSGTGRTVLDPTTNQPFPGSRIPESRFSPASRFFFPYLLLPNSAGDRYRDVAPLPSDTDNSMLRVDQQIGNAQRLFARWVRVGSATSNRGYRPDIVRTQDLVQHNAGLNYNWTVTPNALFTLAAGYLESDTRVDSPQVGRENLTERAGIQGFATAGREEAIGLPNIAFPGYAGISMPAQVPGRFRREDLHGKLGVVLVRGRHSIGAGYEYNDRRTLAHHASASPRGTFTFNGQYTGDPFADFLLGLLQSDERNYPLKAFGMSHSPYSAVYLQDNWRVRPSVTLTYGLRYDRWHEKRLVRNNGSTFVPELRKVVAAVDDDGRVDLRAQPTAPFLAAAARDLWITAAEAGIPRGLFRATGYFAPRLGGAWRVGGKDVWVLRGGYGIFASSYNGNVTGSQVIGPPFWTFERQTFTRGQMQRWETAFPADPHAFVNPSVAAAAYNVEPMKNHEFNVSLQRALVRLQSAITVSYVGNRGGDLISRRDYNEVLPGSYPNLQAARPFPTLGTVRLYENIGRSWYNALHVKMERRFARGLGYGVAYAFSRHVDELGDSLTDSPVPGAPRGYHRGRSELERRHLLTMNSIWEVPYGHGRRWGAALNRAADAILGGWQVTGIYSFTSGEPLTFTMTGATLGNGFNTRPNLVGDPRLADPTAERWFDLAAFSAPPRFAFGNSGLGIIDGPAAHVLDMALMKQFRIWQERLLQLRWEVFNVPNHVNLGTPGTQFGFRAADGALVPNNNTGVISAAGPARQMQFGLKFVF